MEAIRSSETSVQSTTSTRRHTPEDGILHYFLIGRSQGWRPVERHERKEENIRSLETGRKFVGWSRLIFGVTPNLMVNLNFHSTPAGERALDAY
jgi:hypothetical protein